MINYECIDDDGKLKKRYINKKYAAKYVNIEFDLTFNEYCELVSNAGLKSSNLGYNGDNYVLARYNDTGGYSKNNCRFITQKENMKERKISENIKRESSKNIHKAIEKYKSMSFEEKSEAIKKGQQNSEIIKNNKLKQEKLLEQRRLLLDSRYCGIHNSQYGTYWITNNINNLKWSDKKGPIPKGYKKGRNI